MKNRETILTKENYARNLRLEWKRLVCDPYHRLEFDSTLELLREYLPPQGRILDAGGGPGRYTIELAQRGYQMTLFDLLPEHLEFAKKRIRKTGVTDKVEALIPGSIADLSVFPDDRFDAVICLGGPLSHLAPESERRKAVAELTRVAKPGAPVFASVMSKFGVLLSTPLGWPQAISDRKYLEDFIRTGDDYQWRGDGYCHFYTAAELRDIFSLPQLEFLTLSGLEGLNVDLKATNRLAKKYPQSWENWRAIHAGLCREPFVAEASGHMMIIVRKKQPV